MSGPAELQSRRYFLKFAASTAAVAVLAGEWPRAAQSDDLPHVSQAEPTAKALGYVEDAAMATHAKRKPGDACANCQFYTGKAKGYGPCQLFPDKAVAARGWCISHTTQHA